MIERMDAAVGAARLHHLDLEGLGCATQKECCGPGHIDLGDE